MDWYSDVFQLVFPDVEPETVNKIWKQQLKEDKKSKKRQEKDDESGDDD